MKYTMNFDGSVVFLCKITRWTIVQRVFSTQLCNVRSNNPRHDKKDSLRTAYTLRYCRAFSRERKRRAKRLSSFLINQSANFSNSPKRSTSSSSRCNHFPNFVFIFLLLFDCSREEKRLSLRGRGEQGSIHLRPSGNSIS